MSAALSGSVVDWRGATRGCDVSVVIHRDAGHRFIGEAIASVVSQPDLVREVVVVDTARVPADAVSEPGYGFPEVRVLRRVGMDRAAARRCGTSVCSAPYVCFLDGDDRVAPGGLHALSDALRRHPDWGMVSGGARCFDAGGDVARALVGPRLEAGDDPKAALRRSYMYPLGAVLIRRSTLESVGGWVPPEGSDHGAELDVYLRIAQAGPIGRVASVVNHCRVPYRNLAADVEALVAEIAAALASGRGCGAPTHDDVRKAGSSRFRVGQETARFVGVCIHRLSQRLQAAGAEGVHRRGRE